MKSPLSCMRFLLTNIIFACAISSAYGDTVAKESVLQTMKSSSRFMMEKVSYKGGFVWSYLPDFSRQWGELEANRTMIWLQPPGTATVGHVLLDAFHATGDEYYYRAAEQVADAIIRAQLPSGGWNYVADFAGESSLRDWYATVGKNAWRLEEFQVYYGNGTFDDGGTIDAATFLLRMYLEKKNTTYRKPLTKAVDFVLKSQYHIGGWPQRFPPRKARHHHNGMPDYSAYITFNDDVANKNIEFLLMYKQALGDANVVEAIRRGMSSYLALQMKPPQAGWALQYDLSLSPAAARSFEPKSIATGTTVDNILHLIEFYRLTGDMKFLQSIPLALDWLETTKLPETEIKNGRDYAGNVEVGTGKFLYTHRRGSNVANGEYYVDYHHEKTLAHYGSTRRMDIAKLRAIYAEALALPAEELQKNSVLNNGKYKELPKFFTFNSDISSDLNFRAQQTLANEDAADNTRRIINSLNKEGYWPTPLIYTSHPYKGEPPKTELSKEERYAETMVGDEWDTSPYPTDKPVSGISTAMYIKNMSSLIRYLVEQKQ
ncbi:MAG: pectate lyase [Cellvibrio sp.]